METVGHVFNAVTSELSNLFPRRAAETKEIYQAVEKSVQRQFQAPMSGGHFLRLAGLSGGIAVAMSAYGAHAFNPAGTEEDFEELARRKNVFESGNKMHLIHSVALMGTPLMKRPKLVGITMLTGMLIFSGTCYYTAITGDRRVRMATPYGGVLLILSWFLMIL